MSRNQQANLTWVATNVCKMQIKCNGRKFDEGENRVCGKTCRKCRTRRETRIINVSDFPGKTRSMTCQCKVWGTTAVRTEKIIVEKACEYLYWWGLVFISQHFTARSFKIVKSTSRENYMKWDNLRRLACEFEFHQTACIVGARRGMGYSRARPISPIPLPPFLATATQVIH